MPAGARGLCCGCRGTKVAPRGWAPSPRWAPSPVTPCQSPWLGGFRISPKNAASSYPVVSPAQARGALGAGWAPRTWSLSSPQHPGVLTGLQEGDSSW